MKKIFIVLIILIIVWFGERRHFYRLNDEKYITIWKTYGGTCYIIPYRYFGIIAPSHDFIKTSNINTVTIIDDPTSEYDFIICNDYNKDLSMNIEKFKIKYYDFEIRDQFVEKYYTNNMINKNLSYLMIDIREVYAILNGVEQ